jgi:hypothetical protein
MSQCRKAGWRRAGAAPAPVLHPVREKGPISLSSRAASYTADKANRNPSGSYTRDANRGNNDTESAGDDFAPKRWSEGSAGAAAAGWPPTSMPPVTSTDALGAGAAG